MERILGNPKVRKLFYLLCLAVLILLGIARFFVSYTVVDSVLNDVIASIVTTVLIGTFAFYVFPKEEDLEFKIIEPTRIKTELLEGRLSTDHWYFTGGTGIYTRAVTLPELAKRARSTNTPIDIKLQIIDPLNIDLCRKYAEYRRGLNTSSTTPSLWNYKYVRNHSFATIVKSVIISSQEPLVEISIGLKNNFSLFRIDLCSTRVVVTKEDPREVAFIFYRSSSSFNSYVHEFRETFKQTKPLKEHYETMSTLEELDTEGVKKILLDLEIFIDIDQHDLKVILGLATSKTDPYA